MNLNSYKIGYRPYKSGCKVPGDRRRFAFYAKEKAIPFEEASFDKQYDIVYLTIGCNISKWLDNKKKYPDTKIIFEIIDSYYLDGLNFFTALRGLVYFLTGREKIFYLNYRKAIIKMIRVADAVVCSTPVQKAYLLKYNSNVHVSLDYFLDDIRSFKTEFSTHEKLKLVWEGQAYTVHHLLAINDIFEKFANQIELRIITDPEAKYAFKIFNRKTAEILAGLKCDYRIYNWEKDSFSQIIADSDLAIIPLQNNKYGKHDLNKPENKMLLLWQIGIPVITTATPAYTRVMDTAQLSNYCFTHADWQQKLEQFLISTEAEKKEMLQKQTAYLNKYHSKSIILENWDRIFQSVLK